MTFTLHTNVSKDSHCECFPRHCLEHVRQYWASRLRTPWHLGVAVALIVNVIAFGFTPKTKAEESGHLLHHESHYRHWKQPGTNISCCSDHDCAPVKAEFRRGQWFALPENERKAGPDKMSQDQRWLELRESEWIAVPDAKIIRERNPTVEGGHLCYSSGKVICFLPPNTGG